MGQHHKVLDFRGKHHLFCKEGEISILFCEESFKLLQLSQHGWDVWMLQEQEVSFFL